MAATVAARPELVRHILSFLDSAAIARAERAARVFLREGRAERLPRNDVPLLRRDVTRARRGYTTSNGVKMAHYEAVPMSRAANYPCRDSLLQRIEHFRQPRARRSHPFARHVGWAGFFELVEQACRGLAIAAPSTPATKELAHFKAACKGFVDKMDALYDEWDAEVLMLKTPWMRHTLTTKLAKDYETSSASILLKHAGSLSYGTMYLVCHLAKMV